MMKIRILIPALLILFSCQKNAELIYAKDYVSLSDTVISLEEMKMNRYNVFIAFSNDCPVCKASIPTLKKLDEQFPEVGLVLFYPSNQRDASINAFIADLVPNNTKAVKDKNKYLTQFFNATVTPHAFIADSIGNVLYRGAINNGVFTNYRKNYAKQESFLLNALDTLINQNKLLKQHETKVVGCYIE